MKMFRIKRRRRNQELTHMDTGIAETLHSLLVTDNYTDYQVS